MQEMRGLGGNANRWRAVYDLLEEAFQGLPSGIHLAEQLGYPWSDVSTPFTLFEGDLCLSHVGLLTHPMVIQGEKVSVAGIHAVCTTESMRRQGLCGRLMGSAMKWADRDHALAKLHTDQPHVYRSHGFQPARTYHFYSNQKPTGENRGRLLTPSRSVGDLDLLKRMYGERSSISHVLDSAENGWMPVMIAALEGMLDSLFWYVEEQPMMIAYQEQEDRLEILDVIAAAPPTLAGILAALPVSGKPLCWTFTPDLFDPEAIPEELPWERRGLMTRGPWPDTMPPFGISPLWQH